MGNNCIVVLKIIPGINYSLGSSIGRDANSTKTSGFDGSQSQPNIFILLYVSSSS